MLVIVCKLCNILNLVLRLNRTGLFMTWEILILPVLSLNGFHTSKLKNHLQIHTVEHTFNNVPTDIQYIMKVKDSCLTLQICNLTDLGA